MNTVTDTKVSTLYTVWAIPDLVFRYCPVKNNTHSKGKKNRNASIDWTVWLNSTTGITPSCIRVLKIQNNRLIAPNIPADSQMIFG